jgi:hypothetical protein
MDYNAQKLMGHRDKTERGEDGDLTYVLLVRGEGLW